MAAPTPTARQDPAGVKIDDGYRTLICPESDPNIVFWEKTVTPPGIDGGDANETTTMHNDTWRTMAPRSLKTLTDSTLTAAYDPYLYTDILGLINTPTVWTVTFPDGDTLAFWGYLRSFEPDALAEGSQPECTLTITPTNYDPTAGTEEAPVLTGGTT